MLKLNLLPAERKRSWALAQQLRQWRGTMIMVIAACLVINAGMVGLNYYQDGAIKRSNKDLLQWQELNAKRESGQVTESTAQLNATIDGLQLLFTALSTETLTPAKVLATLPSGIQLDKATFESDGTFVLTGIAATRASFLALRSALDDSPLVQDIATTSTANLREKLPFEYTGSLVLTP